MTNMIKKKEKKKERKKNLRYEFFLVSEQLFVSFSYLEKLKDISKKKKTAFVSKNLKEDIKWSQQLK